MYRTSRPAQSFCVWAQGELSGEFGYWVEDNVTYEVGFVLEGEGVFWLYADQNAAWVSKGGRRLRCGHPTGKGEGKGQTGFRYFVPF